MRKIILFIGILFSSLISFGEDMHDKGIISHGETHFDLSLHKQNLIKLKNPTLPIKEELKLLDQLSEFELGRFLLNNKGLNGYWTSYIILHAPRKQNLHPLENWLVNSSPVIKATRNRYQIFHEQLQKRIGNNMKLASVPSGLMDDLFSLDYSNLENIQLYAIDLDQESIEYARENAKQYNISNVDYIKSDAWHLEQENYFDIITSNGLNIYEPDDEKVIELYRNFFNALKPGGILITSFLTPSPEMSEESSWRSHNKEAQLKQKAILGDIIGARWRVFRTEKQTKSHMEQAGFKVLEVIYDEQGMFPTIIVQKP